MKFLTCCVCRFRACGILKKNASKRAIESSNRTSSDKPEVSEEHALAEDQRSFRRTCSSGQRFRNKTRLLSTSSALDTELAETCDRETLRSESASSFNLSIYYCTFAGQDDTVLKRKHKSVLMFFSYIFH